jgi:hypothetical protein
LHGDSSVKQKPSGFSAIKELREKPPKKQEATQMVKRRKKDSIKRRNGKGCERPMARPRRITASTDYGNCSERLSPFGGLLALIKFLDLIGLEEIFEQPTGRLLESLNWVNTEWSWAF